MVAPARPPSTRGERETRDNLPHRPARWALGGGRIRCIAPTGEGGELGGDRQPGEEDGDGGDVDVAERDEYGRVPRRVEPEPHARREGPEEKRRPHSSRGEDGETGG